MFAALSMLIGYGLLAIPRLSFGSDTYFGGSGLGFKV